MIMIGWVVFLFLAGISLVLAEFFVPGLICGVIGFGLVIASCVLGGMYYPDHVFMIILIEFIGAVCTILFGFYLFPRTSVGKALILEQGQEVEAGWVSNESEESLVGLTGEVYSALRPAGSITLDDRRIDAVSDGTFLDKGTSVRVIEVRGNRVVVDEASVDEASNEETQGTEG